MTDILRDFSQFDEEHVWHPYTSLPPVMVPFAVKGANGNTLHLADGRTVIDGVSSWWSAAHGYNHPEIQARIAKQLADYSHVMFGGLTHPAAVELAEKLLAIVPNTLTKIFFADSGSIAAEVAMKMACQYQMGMGRPGRKRMLTVKCGYHGDTFGTMALSDPEEGMHSFFGGNLAQHYFAPAPQKKFDESCNDADLQEMKRLLDAHENEIAAVMLEPVLQGAGGMRIYSPDYLNRLRSLCDQYDVLLIFDEIATGFFRTGKLFATEYTRIQPDILCLGKALTGGFLTLAATLCSDKVAEGIARGPARGALMHGPTFMANALACAAASASVELFTRDDTRLQQVKRIEEILKEELPAAANAERVKDIRILGAVGVIQMDRPVNGPVLSKFFIDECGVWLRPFGDVIYTMMPFITPEQDARTIARAMVAAAQLAYQPERSFC